MAGPAGIEPTPLGSKPSILSIELRTEKIGAGEQVRTVDIYLGKVMLYQLSYARILAPRPGFEPGFTD